MNISERVVLRDKKQLLQHRKLHPAAFERIITGEDALIRYYAAHPAVLLGEALKMELEKSGEAIGRLIFFQQFDEQWYVCALEGKAHLREFIGDLSEIETQFSYELHQAKHLLVASEGDLLLTKAPTIEDHASIEYRVPFLIDKQASTAALTPIMWQDLSLDPYKKKNVILPVALALGGALIIGVGGWWGQSIDSPPPVPVAPVTVQTDEARFIEQFTTQPLAYPLLMNAVAMAVEAQGLPPSMVLKGLSYDTPTQRLVGEVDKGHSRIKTRRDWANTSIERQVRWDEVNGELVSPPLPLASWGKVAVEQFLPDMVDALETFNVIVVTEPAQRQGSITHYTYQLSFNGKLGALSLWAPVLNASFITMTSLTMTVTGGDTAQLEAKIMIQGTQDVR